MKAYQWQNLRNGVENGGSKQQASAVSDQAAGALEHRKTAIRCYQAAISMVGCVVGCVGDGNGG